MGFWECRSNGGAAAAGEFVEVEGDFAEGMIVVSDRSRVSDFGMKFGVKVVVCVWCNWLVSPDKTRREGMFL